MAPRKTPASKTSPRAHDDDHRELALTRLGLLAAGVMWTLLLLALVSFTPGDPPFHGVSVHNDPVHNWIGPVGAFVAYHAFAMLGVGVWFIVASIGAFIAHAAFRGPVGHASIRMLGVAMIGVAVSGMHALLFPAATVFPEGAGGMLAATGTAELQARFGAIGAGMWIVLIAAIGATVAFDRWLIVVPAALGRMMGSVTRRSSAIAGAASRSLEARRRARLERANDIDDDARLRSVEAVMKAAAKGRKKKTTIDEDAGGLGGAEDFDHDAGVVVNGQIDDESYDEAEDDEEYEYEDEADDEEPVAEDGEDLEEEAVGAPQVFDPESLKDKISKLPVRFANTERKAASDEDLDAIRAKRASEEEADRNYAFPPLDLLENPEENFSEEMEQYVREQAEALEEALKTYRIDGEVVSIESGPVITLYQVSLSPGTKVSSVTSVSSDIARMLKAVNVRIVPNTEGLDTVGIEVPNQMKEKVRLKELMASDEQTNRMKLPLFLGKDASGSPLIIDLASLPHMLIAGTTGSGKSVCMNAIIMGFLYTQKPSDLKLVLVDPKMVELSQFKDIPHLMCPVVTEMSKAAAILEWAVTKMDERYELLAEAGCRDISAYNALGWEELRERLNPKTEIEEAKIPRKLPYMVFIIDELADLMMTNKEVESAIVRIAQKARAVGIHLILATQRPQANVVTGLIKSNMPGRLAFKVASGMDSRIVLDQKGGELLLGQGDMLMLTPRSSATMRSQGTLVDDIEIRRVVKFLRDNATSSFDNALVRIGDHGFSGTPEEHEEKMRKAAQEDPLFDRAVELVIETGRGSVSMLQRRLAIGYTRSARLIEMMGEAGIIGEHKGTVAREVTLTLEEWHAMKELARGESSESDNEDPMLFPDSDEGADADEQPAAAREDTDERADDDAPPFEADGPARSTAEPKPAPAATEPAPDDADDAEEGDDEPEDEAWEEEDGEGEEYEYVDEDGNPIDPSGLSEDDDEYEYEYEYVDAEDDESEDADDDTKAAR